ncbi:nucleotidyltransferase domain-containing protein [uncultured Microscilla sp.]|uniref:nucleotidyltransferase domain-containing protein n=1 Tax=uncultured Microscilla sp. TaxID=432653 RepID=UPI0026382B28|nr:nucleotidyltransferase domain-containing protein [uncultured Microscilla sp.]
MHTTIQNELAKLEESQNIEILYACESGSRAWGFPSPDSDYDVRFFYRHSRDKYLSIHPPDDNINLFVTKDLDFNGWEIRKALHLFGKSNVSPYEWMQSDTLYLQKTDFIERLRAIAPQYFSPRAAIHHYLGIAHNTFESALKEPEVKLKKYFYALRTVLSAYWIAQYQSIPPLQFYKLLPLIEDEQLISIIQDLLEQKAKAKEGETIAPELYVHEFIKEGLKKCEIAAQKFEKLTPNWEPLNALFRESIGDGMQV